MKRKSTVQSYDSLVKTMASARKSFEDAQLGAMNEMAELIIEDGNMTPRLDEFAFAMHGLVGYRSRNKRTGAYAELRDDEKNEDAEMYDEIEKSTSGISDQIMMYDRDAYAKFAPEFAMVPGRIARLQAPLAHISLRFTMHRDEHSDVYTGGISLPILSTRTLSSSPEPTPSYIPVARFSRNIGDIKPQRLEVHDDGLASWHIGKRAVVAAGIQDYSTKLKEDIEFLEHLDASTVQLSEASEQVTEDLWRDVWLHD